MSTLPHLIPPLMPSVRRSEGLGIITFDGATLVSLGGCTLDEQVSLLRGPSACFTSSGLQSRHECMTHISLAVRRCPPFL